MPGSLGVTETTDTGRSQLEAGSFRAMKKVTVASGQNLGRGTVVGINTTTYKYSQLAPAAVDGTEVARLILADDIDASAADATGQAYGPGEYRSAAVVWPGGITQAQKDAALLQLQDRGIIVK